MKEQQFTTPGPVALEVRVAAGTIAITTVDGEESSVTLDGPPKVLDAMNVGLAGNRLKIDEQRKPLIGWFGRLGESLRVEARVPHGSTVAISTASGDSSLDGSFAGLELRSASGGAVVAGDVEGDADVKTVSGDVRLRRLAGDLTVQSVSGGVTADSVGGSVVARSVSGSVRIGSLREGTVNVQSVSGHLELGIASGSNIDIDAGSASGQLSSEVALAGTPSQDPGPAVVIRGSTVSGDIRIVRADSTSHPPTPATAA